MLFNSNAFYLFLPIVFTLYWVMPAKYRWGILFLSSYYFYMSWNTKYVFLILLTTIVSYVTAILLARTTNQKKKKIYLILALVISLGVLFLFKYFNFFSNSLFVLLQSMAIPMQETTLNLMLPVGISFYTFQTLSYVIDVYQGRVKPTTHFGKYATFISFFPQLVAGPIERTENLLPQIEGEHKFQQEKAIAGAKLIVWGFFKKIAIADGIASVVDIVYNNATDFVGFPLAFTTILFAFQIYCDFSGYSDIAIGVAKLFDIDLMTNFKSPYFSTSIKEFWSRWHISLSTWFRDYVYIPLGGNRCTPWKQRRNIMITFLVSGLWHGANWTYVVWGGIHGVGQILEERLHKITKGKLSGNKFISFIGTFAFVCFAWIFFRANTLSDAFYVITHMFDGILNPITYMWKGFLDFRYAAAMSGVGLGSIAEGVGCILILLVYDFVSLKVDIWGFFKEKPKAVRYAVYFILLFIVLYSRRLGEYEFVYFQF